MLLAVELPESIEPDQLKTAAIVGIVILAVIAFMVMRFVQKLVFKLVMLAALVGAGVFLYAQRDDLDECQQKLRSSFLQDCRCGFAGFDVTVPRCESLRPQPDG